MNVEQKYGKCGRISDGFYHEEIPPEDWQFENPIVRQTITGRKEVKVPKLDLAAILPRPKETTEKEAITMKFADFDLDKQARLVAEEYNKKTTITEIREKFDLNVYKLDTRAAQKAAQDIKQAYGVKDSGNRREFETGAVRDMAEGKGRYDLLPWKAIHELALHCEAGAVKYGERNCEKGIPISSLIDSAFRHLSKYMQGMNDEPHLRAALWNIAYAIYHEKVTPEMQDIPSRQ